MCASAEQAVRVGHNTSGLEWSQWIPLWESWRGSSSPALPGLYRIRRSGRDDLEYLGQTGSGSMNLRKRLAMLRGLFADEMPYRDPHTAAPALWALRDQHGCHFEVSVAPVEGSTPWRKGLEALEISRYRQEQGRSPTLNFGRMPAGYRMSSSNNAGLVRDGKRFRGGAFSGIDQSHLPGIPPIGPLDGNVWGSGWCGHAWSDWMPGSKALLQTPQKARGLYRLRDPEGEGLLYIGQGEIRSRLVAHLRKAHLPGDPQGQIFRSAHTLECSWAVNTEWHPHQRLELENDLIAAHLLYLNAVPPAQFLG